MVVNDQFRIVKAFAGNWLAAHRRACSLVESIDGVTIPETAPLVIASAGGYPKDINFYQTIKLLSNALAAASPEATIILLSRCHDGFGDADCQSQICDFSSMEERERALRTDLFHRRICGVPVCRSGGKAQTDSGNRHGP